MAISKGLRFEVFKRDKFTCQYCGRRPPDVMLEADHVVPASDGGTTTIDNLTTACVDCNRGKGAKGLGDVAPALDDDEVMAALQEMLERKLTIKRQIEAVNAKHEADTAAVEAVLEWWRERFDEDTYPRRASLIQFVNRLELEQIRYLIDVTHAHWQDRKISWHDHWRYFCGCCWRTIRRNEGSELEPEAENAGG